MSYTYKLDNNWVSSALLPLETIFTTSSIKATASAVNIFTENNVALGINSGSRRIAYKHNDILFKTASLASGGSKITYVTRPSIARGFVQWSGSFNRENILEDLLSMTFVNPPSQIEVNINSNAKTLTSVGDMAFDISWTASAISVNGTPASGNKTLSFGSDSVTIDLDSLLLKLNGDFSSFNKIDYASSQPFDLSYSLIDCEDGVFEEREIVIDYGSQVTDDYGHQYFSVPDYPVHISQNAIWLPSSSKKYLPNDQFTFLLPANGNGNAFVEFNKDRLRSAINTSTTYNEGLIEASVRTYIGYVKVYSSYIYVDYYYIKSNVSGEECAQLEGSISYGRACRVKVYADKILISNIDSSLDHVSLAPNANALAPEAFAKMRFGAGSFKSNYRLYTYKDRRSYLEVIFNRESSSKYVKIRVDDESTRYKATITIVSGTQHLVSTKTFPRYSSNPEWNLAQTGVMNMILKRALDNVSDTTETLFTNSAVTLDQDTIKILTRTLYVNILEQAVAFPQINLTYDTLAVVAWNDSSGHLENLQINFQPATGAIYGRIAQASSYDYYTRVELIDMLNELNSGYTFDITCNISSLNYEDTDGVQHIFPFTNSTMIIGELVNGSGGQFYRVYYKNADSYGFVNAKTYRIEE